MAYSSASDIAALCQQLIGSEETFSANTCPTLVEVNTWLSTGCAIINATLTGKGYSTPVASTVAAYDWVKQINSFYGAAMAEWSRTNFITGPGERTRGQRFEDMFWDQLDRLTQMDLTLAGVGRQTAGKIYAGGISFDDKQIDEEDDDVVGGRFKRSMFATPGTVRPDTKTGSQP